VLVCSVVVPIISIGFIQVTHYTIALEVALGRHPIVIMKTLCPFAIVRISAVTLFIINLQSVRFSVMNREIYLKIRNLWSVMAEIFLGDALVARRPALLRTIGI